MTFCPQCGNECKRLITGVCNTCYQLQYYRMNREELIRKQKILNNKDREGRNRKQRERYHKNKVVKS